MRTMLKKGHSNPGWKLQDASFQTSDTGALPLLEEMVEEGKKGCEWGEGPMILKEKKKVETRKNGVGGSRALPGRLFKAVAVLRKCLYEAFMCPGEIKGKGKNHHGAVLRWCSWCSSITREKSRSMWGKGSGGRGEKTGLTKKTRGGLEYVRDIDRGLKKCGFAKRETTRRGKGEPTVRKKSSSKQSAGTIKSKNFEYSHGGIDLCLSRNPNWATLSGGEREDPRKFRWIPRVKSLECQQ